MYAIKRPINGISLNGDEFLLTNEKEVKVFENEEAAKQFLAEHDIPEEAYEGIGLQIVPHNS